MTQIPKPLPGLQSTHLNEIIRVSRFGGGASMTCQRLRKRVTASILSLFGFQGSVPTHLASNLSNRVHIAKTSCQAG
ncbi:hypothetical protein [Floridanema flaviceps]|uniref:hypothetical protein n=1 Tax=Floridanema flaviceps TaxID=3396170 RepID=UPI0039A6D15E